MPIDGVGHQMHNNVDFPSAAAVITTLNLFTALGLENEITELDVSIYSSSFPQPFTAYEDIPADRFVRQAFKYRDLFRAFRYLSGRHQLGDALGAGRRSHLADLVRPRQRAAAVRHGPEAQARLHGDHESLGAAGRWLDRVFSGAFIVRPDRRSGRRTAAATLELSNNGPSGTMRFNFNDPSTRVRFTSTDVITYDCHAVGGGLAGRFHRGGHERRRGGLVVTGYAIDGGPAGSGADALSITVRTATGALIFAGDRCRVRGRRGHRAVVRVRGSGQPRSAGPEVRQSAHRRPIRRTG